MRKAFKILAVTTLALTLALPFTAYASQWIQSTAGWKVQADDGIYLTNQWYQNTDGKWYYIGADGYMMVNAITPDGYQVGADGAWIQPQKAEPVVQPTQSSSGSDDSMISEEEFDRIMQEAGITDGTNGKGETINSADGWSGDIDAADFNWHQ